METFSIEMRYKYESHSIWIKCAQNDNDKASLRILVRESKLIARLSEKTGLRIVYTFERKSGLYVAMVIGKKPKLDEDGIRALRSQILQQHSLLRKD